MLSVEANTHRAHPHGCGEHAGQADLEIELYGSSPRVWGTQNAGQHDDGRRGLIPTGVGNTPWIWVRPLLVRAHPHGCGEHVGGLQINAAEAGSSPRVWGTQVHGKGGKVRLGLIPTGVGNTVQGR